MAAEHMRERFRCTGGLRVLALAVTGTLMVSAPGLALPAAADKLPAMSANRVTPIEAAEMLEQGYKYLDVRSRPEFDQGHPTGAWNVPLLNAGPGGRMQANADFLAVVKSNFATDAKLLVGCKSGGRSARAAEMLADVGYSELVDVRGGFSGEPDPAGGVAVAGWKDSGLPVSEQPEAGHSYAELQGKTD
ncbi:MAG: rhodanese-like domain-containing protein [bacterium]